VRKFSTNVKDLYLARASGLCLIIGAFTIAFAINPALDGIGIVIMSLGGGCGLLIRSLLTSLVEPHHIGTLYTLIAVCETTGTMVAGPLLSTSFSWGLKLGGLWVGMPFMVVGCLYSIATLIVWTVRIPKPSVSSSFDEEN
jgi:hypothetical protein